MKNPALTILCLVLGVPLLALAAEYAFHPADQLPAFLPGYDAALHQVHLKHAIGSLLLGLGAFVLAWFQSGPAKQEKAD